MKRINLAVILIAVLLVSGIAAFAETADTGIWETYAYVDEFEMPTDEWYVSNVDPIVGTFNNSAVSKERLHVSILADDEGIAFILYEYGNNQVKNPYSETRQYDIIMLTDTGEKIPLNGFMAFTGNISSGRISFSSTGDRIKFNDKNEEKLWNAFKNNNELSFYVAETDNSLTNYLFTASNIKEFISEITEARYQDAIALREAGNQYEAIDAFSVLDGYRDSIDQINAIKEEIYQVGISQLDAGKYDNAVTTFESIKGYSDADTQIKEAKYRKGVAQLAAGEYYNAAIIFRGIKGYSDADTQVKEVFYQLGNAYLDAGQYDDAIAMFESISGYGDVDMQMKELYYNNGISQLVAGKYDQALLTFDSICDYKDAKQIIALIKYVQAYSYILSGDLNSAIDLYKTISDYGNTTDILSTIDSIGVLQKGDKGEEVKALQKALIQLEALNGKADGDYGKKTESAVANLQSYFGMDTTGIADAAFQLYLQVKTATASESEASVENENQANAISVIKSICYTHANALNTSGKYSEAYAVYANLKDYADVNKILSEDANISAVVSDAIIAPEGQDEVDNVVTFGHYDEEPIEWLILEKDSDKLVLISKDILDRKPYNIYREDTSWDKCSLRHWLNDDFLNEAFTQEEQDLLVTTTVTVDNDPQYFKRVVGKETNDKVYLLGISEFKTYFDYKSDITNWWLRSLTFNQVHACYVNYDGVLSHYQYCDESGGVRPVIVVSLS